MKIIFQIRKVTLRERPQPVEDVRMFSVTAPVSGDMIMEITDPAGQGQFQAGDRYEVEFTKVEPAEEDADEK